MRKHSYLAGGDRTEPLFRFVGKGRYERYSYCIKISLDTPIRYTEEIKMLVLSYRKMEAARDIRECLNKLLI